VDELRREVKGTVGSLVVEVGFFQSAILVSGTVLLGAVLAKLVFVGVRFVFLL
jgi:hypothetical protein